MSKSVQQQNNGIRKCETGIQGLDEITRGGVPCGRPTLITGQAGTGKSVLSMEFLIRGAESFGEPGVYLSFEETKEEIIQNVSVFGWNVNELIKKGKLKIDHVRVEPAEFMEAGGYDLEGLFIRLGSAIDEINAKRVVIDTLEVLNTGLTNTGVVRAEMRRLFRWLKEKQVTAFVTSELRENDPANNRLEEFVSDCVIGLNHRIENEVSTRHLRIVKYRGSGHGTNEYPFLIGDSGISVLPITSLTLNYVARKEFVSTGVEKLDSMLSHGGYYRGSSILISGAVGTGKTSLAAHFVEAACKRGEKAFYFAFEESESQLIRNMSSIGLNLQKWRDRGLLKFRTVRPSHFGVETHLAEMHNLIKKEKPSVVVVDPISNLTFFASDFQIKFFWMRFIDFLKSEGITGLFTCLIPEQTQNSSEMEVSSLMDTWISVLNFEANGERNRILYVLKSRGMSHSNQVREFRFTPKGIDLKDVYLGPEGVLTGSARKIQELREETARIIHQKEVESRKRNLERKRKVMKAKIEALRAQFEVEEEESRNLIEKEKSEMKKHQFFRSEMASIRGNNGNHVKRDEAKKGPK